jgi:hypothetical protein
MHQVDSNRFYHILELTWGACIEPGSRIWNPNIGRKAGEIFIISLYHAQGRYCPAGEYYTVPQIDLHPGWAFGQSPHHGSSLLLASEKGTRFGGISATNFIDKLGAKELVLVKAGSCKEGFLSNECVKPISRRFALLKRVNICFLRTSY